MVLVSVCVRTKKRRKEEEQREGCRRRRGEQIGAQIEKRIRTMARPGNWSLIAGEQDRERSVA